jgi:hypothetical protein
LLELTANTLLAEQTTAGGFVESLFVRPRSGRNLKLMAGHILAARGRGALVGERFARTLAVLRPKHDRVHTHWSRYSRRWNEPDLFDSWFRMLSLARIDSALRPGAATQWGFIDYPGIGCHRSLHASHGRRKSGAASDLECETRHA